MLQIVVLRSENGCRQVQAPHPLSRLQARSEGLAEMIGSQSTCSAAGGKLQGDVRIYYDCQNETETRKQRSRNALSRWKGQQRKKKVDLAKTKTLVSQCQKPDDDETRVRST
jgi:hypothetical protein